MLYCSSWCMAALTPILVSILIVIKCDWILEKYDRKSSLAISSSLYLCTYVPTYVCNIPRR